MRTPKRQKARIPRGQVSNSISYPAPIGGWNARDALADMPPTDAVALENWFPKTSYCETRDGYSSFATGMGEAGKTLAVYTGIDGTNEMYCTTAAHVYDVSASGAVGASVASRTNGKHQWTMFGDGTTNYLILCNGADKPLYYDGTNWTAVDAASTPALTGVTSSLLVAPNVYQGRLFFIEVSSLSFWYLAAGAAGGALTEFPLDAECKRGGYLMAMATWTVDAGDGIDDRAVFITSEGEVLVYIGTNPSSAAAWQKVGNYFIGKPIGRRCFAQYGGDIVIITQNGAFPLSAALQSTTLDNHLALSFKIENAFNDAAKDYFSIFGWKPIVFPKESALIVNVPHAENGTHEQFVMNTITKAWCKFTGWDAEDFAEFNRDLYFVDGTVVYKAWSGTSDNNTNIVAYGKQAFTYLGRKGLQKRVTAFRPVLGVNGTLSFLTDLDVDFRDIPITGTATYTPVTGGVWGTGVWGTSLWGSSSSVLKEWTSPAAYPGEAFAAKIKIATITVKTQWMASDWIYEIGGVVG